ncbi:MAG: YddF family protein, partial [Spirochaetaceae bacterium]|nr:YddF family protein [Spirochaetaceae bacterium]
MPQNWIFNTSIITDPGSYKVEKITLQHALEWVGSKKWESAIGHQGTALILSEMLRTEVPTNRVQAHMEPGSEALVFKLMN